MTRPVTGANDPNFTLECGARRFSPLCKTVIGTTKLNELWMATQNLLPYLIRCRPGMRAISAATSYVETGLGQLHPRKARTASVKMFIV